MNFSENTNLLPGGQSASPSKLKELDNKIDDLAQTVTSVADSVADLADEVTTAELNATSANVTNAVIDNATVGTETATEVNADTVNADNLNATDAEITNLTADDVEANSVDADNGYFGSVNAQSFTGQGVNITGGITASAKVQGKTVQATEKVVTPALESTQTELKGATTVRGDVYFPETGDKIYGEYLEIEADKVKADIESDSVNATSVTAGTVTATGVASQGLLVTGNSRFMGEVQARNIVPEAGQTLDITTDTLDADSVEADTVKVNSLTTETPTGSTQLVGYDNNGNLIPVDAGLDPANYWERVPNDRISIQPKDNKKIEATEITTPKLNAEDIDVSDEVYAKSIHSSDALIDGYLDVGLGLTVANGGDTTLRDTEVDGDLTVNGDIIQNGSAYETHAEKVYTKNDLIITRDGAVSGLSTGQYTGIQAKKYDGTNDGQLVFDKDGEARVGDVGDTEPLMTRDELADMTDGSLLKWDGTNKKAVCAQSADIIPADASASNKLATTNSVNTALASLPTDAVLHYSFDEVPDIPDGSANEKNLNGNTYDVSFDGNGTVTTDPYEAGDNKIHKSNVNGNLHYKSDLSVALVRGVFKRLVDYANKIIIIDFYAYTANLQFKIEYRQTSSSPTKFLYPLGQSISIGEHKAILFIPDGLYSCTLTMYANALDDGYSEWELLNWYVGNGSYSTPIIDNANGQNNAVNKGGLAVQGVSGKGVRFFGKSGKIIEHNNIILGSSFTFSFWVNYKSFLASNEQYNLVNYSSSSGNYGIRLGSTNGTKYGIYISGSPWNTILSSLSVNTDYHFVVCFTDGIFNCYVNGEKKLSFSGNPTYNSNKLTIGGLSENANYTPDCIIDDFLVFDRALSDNEVMALYLNKANTPKYYTLTPAQLNAVNSGITDTLVTKLNGIETGAEVNVQADWNTTDTSADSYIKNKPTIPTTWGTAAEKDAGNATGNVPLLAGALNANALVKCNTNGELISSYEVENFRKISNGGAVCSTAKATAAKEVILPGILDLYTGMTVKVLFTNGNSAANPKLKIMQSSGSTIGTYNIKVVKAGAKVTPTNKSGTWRGVAGVTSEMWQPYTTLELMYDGTDFVIMGNPVVESYGGAGFGYEVKADGQTTQWGTKLVTQDVGTAMDYLIDFDEVPVVTAAPVTASLDSNSRNMFQIYGISKTTFYGYINTSQIPANITWIAKGY